MVIRVGRRHWLRRLGALAVCTAGLWLWTTPAAEAVDKLETGVWWRDQTGAATLPAPPQLPPGGLWVSNDPTGPSAISAVRITLPDSEGFLTLSLHVAQLAAQPATPAMPATVAIRACVVTGSWSTPVSAPGEWSARPSYDCAKGSALGQLSPDQGTVVFDVSALSPGRSYSLALVPGTPVAPVADPAQATGSPTFDVTFEPPKPGDVAVVRNAPRNSAAPVPAADIAVGPAPLSLLDVPSLPGVEGQPRDAPAPRAGAPMPPRALAAPIARVIRTSKAVRTIAGLAFCALAAWAWRVLTSDTAAHIGVIDGKEPPGRRTGAPPTLR
jgi:hypothetical protein